MGVLLIMLDLWPRAWLGNVPRKLVDQVAKVLTNLVIAGIAITYNVGVISGSRGWAHFSPLLTYLRRLTHGGIRCPLCGGTRAFLALFNGDVRLALGYSIFGTYIFIATFGLLPFRIIFIITGSEGLLKALQIIDTKCQT